MEIIVKTNKPETKITKIINGIYYIDVKAKPIYGEANKEIIKFFSKKFKKKIRIIKGLKNNKKLLRLET